MRCLAVAAALAVATAASSTAKLGPTFNHNKAGRGPQPLFMWEGEAGEQHVVTVRSDANGSVRRMTLTALTGHSPRAWLVEGLLDDAECDELVSLAAGVGLQDSDTERPAAASWSESYIRDMFALGDVDASGAIDAVELAAALRAADEEVASVLKHVQLDADGDGLVTLQESLTADVGAGYAARNAEVRTAPSRQASLSRNSRQTWLDIGMRGATPASDAFLGEVQRRMAAALNLPLPYVQQNSEALQLVHYSPGQHYFAHTDVSDILLHRTAGDDVSATLGAALQTFKELAMAVEGEFPCCEELQQRMAALKQRLQSALPASELDALAVQLPALPCDGRMDCLLLRSLQAYARVVIGGEEPDASLTPCSNCRYATLLAFLNDVPAGGHTAFPIAGNASMADAAAREAAMATVSNFTQHGCSLGHRVAPSKGSALLWYNFQGLPVEEALAAEGSFVWPTSVDPFSLHGGCDVLEGEKWVANLWLHALPLRRDASGNRVVPEDPMAPP